MHHERMLLIGTALWAAEREYAAIAQPSRQSTSEPSDDSDVHRGGPATPHVSYVTDFPGSCDVEMEMS